MFLISLHLKNYHNIWRDFCRKNWGKNRWFDNFLSTNLSQVCFGSDKVATHRQTDKQTDTNPLGHARSYIVNVAMFFGVLGGASKRYNLELFSMSTKDLSCLLVGETSQGRGSDLSGKRLWSTQIKNNISGSSTSLKDTD